MGAIVLLPICLHEKSEIEPLLRGDDVWLHIYEIGDLEEPFWHHTTWYTLPQKGPRPVLLLYSGLSLPTLLGLTKKHADLLEDLIRLTMPLLPLRFYAHLSPGLSSAFEELSEVEPQGEFIKMSLRDPRRLGNVDTAEVVPLGHEQSAELQRLYEIGYPGHWFEPHMLKTGFYYGIRRDSQLVCAAGVHVCSPTQQVAGLGNVATHPRYRNRGLARAACARLCQDLLRTVDHVGLNVKADNSAAIACYRRLGFEQTAGYEEHIISRRR
jgi:ribosomal protein S18 acetylase RimI-like enzyme